MTTWVYIHSEPQLWTVGFYGPDGRWEPESDHGSTEEAAGRVHYLNGGEAPGPKAPAGPEFNLKIRLDNRVDAHPDALGGILRTVANTVQGGTGTGKVRGVHGNFIGEYDITGTT